MAEKVARPCVCTGVIEADPTDPADIERAVQEHQRDLRHVAHRAGAILRGEAIPSPSEAKVGLTAGQERYRRYYVGNDSPYKRMIRSVERQAARSR